MIKRILCIDGGGIKGVFAASFLANIEKQINGKIADYFDLIVGTLEISDKLTPSFHCKLTPLS